MGTIEATREVARLAEMSKAKAWKCVIVMVDVKNAFNTLRWDVIAEVLEDRRVSAPICGVFA